MKALKKQFLTKLALGLAIVCGSMSAVGQAKASSIILEPSVIGVKVGKTFTVPVVINSAGVSQYTVRFSAAFPPNLLEVTAFSFGKNWLAVPQPGYDLTDNRLGELVKTAGFPKGFTSSADFGMITFRAKEAGTSTIMVSSQSFVLDAQSQSTLESRPQVLVVAAATISATSSIKVVPKFPQTGAKNLFGISLAPQGQTAGAGLVSKVAPGESLPLSVKLLNFGNKNKVDVIVTYQVIDSSGKVIYSSQDAMGVETAATFVKKIQLPFDTPPGRYIAKSSVVYEDQVSSAVTEFPFVVERRILGLAESEFLLYSIFILLVIIFLMFIHRALAKHRKMIK